MINTKNAIGKMLGKPFTKTIMRDKISGNKKYTAKDSSGKILSINDIKNMRIKLISDMKKQKKYAGASNADIEDIAEDILRSHIFYS